MENEIDPIGGALDRSVKAVSSMRFAVGIVGLAAAAGLIAIFTAGIRPVVALPLVLGLMFVLLVFQAASKAGRRIQAPAIFLIWCMSLLFVAGIVLAASAVIFGWPPDFKEYLLGKPVSQEPTKEIEEKAWSMLNLAPTVHGIQEFQREFPNSNHWDQAETAKRGLYKLDADRAQWNLALSTKNRSAMKEVLDHAGDAQLRREIEEKIASLDALDDERWKNVKTPDQSEQYMKDYPGGKHTGDAQGRMALGRALHDAECGAGRYLSSLLCSESGVRRGLLPGMFSFSIQGFKEDSTAVPEDALPKLECLAIYLIAHPDARVSLEGNAWEDGGGRDYSLGVSERRSNAVSSALGSYGVDSRELSSVGYGQERPKCREIDQDCLSTNRRVDVTFSSVVPSCDIGQSAAAKAGLVL